MLLPIYIEPNLILHQICQPIKEFNPELTKLAEDMRESMVNAQGIGLAAPQIGHPIALCVIEIPAEDGDPGVSFLTLVNPRVTWKSPHQVSIVEACLSIPGVEGPVRRPAEVRVKAQNLKGEDVEMRTGGLLARVIQHELDHLNGILFTEYVSKSRLQKREIIDYPRI